MANIDVAKRVEYLAAPENLGPAGALALGAGHLLHTADDADWVMFFDDDNPPRTTEGVSEIADFADEVLRQDPRTGGVGLVGARFNIRSGLMARIADQDLSGTVPVSYIGGGQLPCYRVATIRDVGLPNPRLFFGFDDLDYGLRLNAAGWQLYINGNTLARERHIYGLIGADKSPNRAIQSVGWRDYYSTRNIIWILNSRHHHIAAARVIARRIIAKTVYNLPCSPRLAWAHFTLGVRAAFDAYTGRMGRTIDPLTGETTI
jgi:GT2 family glycosyltransferase